MNDCDICLIFAENIDFVYTLERFLRVRTIYVLERKRKIMHTPVNPIFDI